MSKVILKGFIEIPEEDLAKVIASLPKHTELTLQEHGCLEFKVEQDEKNPTQFHIYEEFISKDAFEFHQERAKASEWGKVTKNIKRNYKLSEVEP